MSDSDFVNRRVATGGAIITPAQVQALVQLGVTHVIDCWGEEDHTGLFQGTGVITFRPPPVLDDGTPKPPSWFAGSLEFALHAFLTPKAKVLAHCCGGVNRGPSTAYAILRTLGYSESEATRLVIVARPVAQLRYRGDAEAALSALGYL